MSENKKENIENKKALNTKELKQTNGGKGLRGSAVCPICGLASYDSWNKKCDSCGYRG